MSLFDLRKSYEKGALLEADAPDQPLALFQMWLQEALTANIEEPNAMTLATVDARGRPSTRVVLIKEYDERGIVWFTNYHSRKGHELEGNPMAALQFHWVSLERVVRIEGPVHRIDPAESDAYFLSRPLASRLGAWASDQSQPISGRSVLVARVAEVGLQYGLNPPRPPHWGGYRLVPDYWEFWQGRPSRLHDRLQYQCHPETGWQRMRLAP